MSPQFHLKTVRLDDDEEKFTGFDDADIAREAFDVTLADSNVMTASLWKSHGPDRAPTKLAAFDRSGATG